jgi:hypothetical protein
MLHSYFTVMGNSYIIRDYCIIRDRQVSLHGTSLFSSGESQPAAFFTEAYRHFGLNYPKFHKMDSLCKLGYLASELLLKDKSLDEKYSGDQIGLVFCNAASSIDTDRIHQLTIQDRNSYFPSPSVFVYTLANIVIGEICIRHKIYGENAFFISENFNPDQLVEYVRLLFDEDIVQCCLAGWLEINGDQYEGVVYLVEKSVPDTRGFVIFDSDKLNEIYLQLN